MCRGRLIRELGPQFRVSVTEIGKTTHLSLRTVCNSLTFSVASKRLNLGPKSKSSKFSFFMDAGIKSGSILLISSAYKLKYNFFVQCSITLCCMCVLVPCNNRKWFIYAENITRKISLLFQNIFWQKKHEDVKKRLFKVSNPSLFVLQIVYLFDMCACFNAQKYCKIGPASRGVHSSWKWHLQCQAGVTCQLVELGINRQIRGFYCSYVQDVFLKQILITNQSSTTTASR